MSDNKAPVDLSKPIDFSQVEDKERVCPLPEGKYVVRVIKAVGGQEHRTKTGYPKIDFVFEVVEGPFKNRKVFYTQTLIKNCLWSFRDLLAGLGIDVSGSVTIGNPKRLVGKQAQIKTAIREYQGKRYTEIKQFSRPDTEDEDTTEESNTQASSGASEVF